MSLPFLSTKQGHIWLISLSISTGIFICFIHTKQIYHFSECFWNIYGWKCFLPSHLLCFLVSRNACSFYTGTLWWCGFHFWCFLQYERIHGVCETEALSPCILGESIRDVWSSYFYCQPEHICKATTWYIGSWWTIYLSSHVSRIMPFLRWKLHKRSYYIRCWSCKSCYNW